MSHHLWCLLPHYSISYDLLGSFLFLHLCPQLCSENHCTSPLSNCPWLIFWFWPGKESISLYFLAQGRAEGIHTKVLAVPNQHWDSAEPSWQAAANHAADPASGCKNPVHRWGDVRSAWGVHSESNGSCFVGLANISGVWNGPWYVTPWQPSSADLHKLPSRTVIV